MPAFSYNNTDKFYALKYILPIIPEVASDPKSTLRMTNRPKTVPTTNAMQERAGQIMSKENHASQIGMDKFKVGSRQTLQNFISYPKPIMA